MARPRLGDRKIPNTEAARRYREKQRQNGEPNPTEIRYVVYNALLEHWNRMSDEDRATFLESVRAEATRYRLDPGKTECKFQSLVRHAGS